VQSEQSFFLPGTIVTFVPDESDIVGDVLALIARSIVGSFSTTATAATVRLSASVGLWYLDVNASMRPRELIAQLPLSGTLLQMMRRRTGGETLSNSMTNAHDVFATSERRPGERSDASWPAYVLPLDQGAKAREASCEDFVFVIRTLLAAMFMSTAEEVRLYFFPIDGILLATANAPDLPPTLDELFLRMRGDLGEQFLGQQMLTFLYRRGVMMVPGADA
jgi:hypothetical protein